jgi:two-component system, NarL family, sensor histidine kinase BarA
MDFKKINFNNRKTIHKMFIACIVLFQVFVLIIFYNEVFNVSKLDLIADEVKSNQKMADIFQTTIQDYELAQAQLEYSLSSRNNADLTKFHTYINEIDRKWEILSNYTQKNANWKTFQVHSRNLLGLKKGHRLSASTNLEQLQKSGDLFRKSQQTFLNFSNTTFERFNKQYSINKCINNYTVFALILLGFVISILLTYLTKFAYENENRLMLLTQAKIQQNLSFKNRIIGMICHEIRSPLSIISIHSKYLSSKIKDKEIKKVFDSVLFTTHSLHMLSNQILEYSKNEQKQLTIQATTFPLVEQLSNVIQSLQVLVADNGNQLVYEHDFDKEIMVHSDVTKIHQLLYNIVGNANKFTTQGVITIQCAVKEVQTGCIQLFLSVKDSGKGISKEDLPHVFDQFYQGVTQGNICNLGVGLGLNLCKELVELFQGKIEVTSEVGKGTTVSFNLQLQTNLN